MPFVSGTTEGTWAWDSGVGAWTSVESVVGASSVGGTGTTGGGEGSLTGSVIGTGWAGVGAGSAVAGVGSASTSSLVGSSVSTASSFKKRKMSLRTK